MLSSTSQGYPEHWSLYNRPQQMTGAKAIRTTMGVREWTLMLVLSAIWGGSFFFIGVAVRELPTLTIVTLRVALAALLLWVYVLLARVPLPASPRTWLELAWMGVLNNVVPFTMLVWGQAFIASGLAAILNATTPLFAVIIAGIMLADEKVTWLKSLGVVIGFSGAVVVIGPGELLGLGDDLLPQLACVAAGLLYAMAGVFGRRFERKGVSPLMVATGMLSASTVMLVPLTLVIDKPWQLPLPTLPAVGSILGLAVLSTTVAYLLYFRILASAGATNAVLVTFLIPATAILLGALVLDERLSLQHFLGMGIICLGLVLVDGRLVRRDFRGANWAGIPKRRT